MTGGTWRLVEVEGITLVRCEAIEAISGVAHAFSTRRAFGRTEFDLAAFDQPAGEMASRQAAFFRAAGVGSASPAMIRQVHGNVIVDAGSVGSGPLDADGVIRVDRRGVSLPLPVVRTADCVAVLIAEGRGAAVAALHAGWRGAAAGIAGRAVRRFVDEGFDARDLVVALGPAILGCCYEVGEEVTRALAASCGAPSGFRATTRSGGAAVDLHAAIRQQLMAAGVPSKAIHAAPWCTRCRPDLFFSFRGEGPGTGRLLAVVGPPSGP